VEFEFDAPAIGVADVGRPVAAVRAESLARFVPLDLDVRLAEVAEQRRHRLARVGLVRAQEYADVLATHVERFRCGHEVEVSPAGGDGHEREFVALETVAVADG
jgi:hypothetical protein